MSLHTTPIVPAAPPPNPLHRGMEVVVATRTAIGRDGWTQSWKELREKAEECMVNAVRDQSGTSPDYHIRRMTLGELVSAAYTPSLQQACFREGSDDNACLAAQAW